MRSFLHLFLAFATLAAVTSKAQTLNTVGTIPSSAATTPTGLAASGTTLFVTNDNPARTLQLYDISTPATPRLLSSTASTLVNPARRVSVSGNTAYVASYAYAPTTLTDVQLAAFDVSNPTAPVLRKTVAVNLLPPLNIVARGEYLYVASGYFINNGYPLLIFNNNLDIVGSVGIGTGAAVNLTVNGPALYIQKGSSSTVYDLSTPTAPTLKKSTSGNVQVINGKVGYGLASPAQGNQPNVILTSDVSDPLNPVLMGNAEGGFGTLLGVLSSGRVLFTVGDGNFINPPSATSLLPLRALEMSMPSVPVQIGADLNAQGAFSLVTSGNYAYAATLNRVNIYTVNGIITATRTKDQAALSIYPTPAHGLLTIKKAPPAASVVIYDLTGRQCLKTSLPANGTIDIHSLPAGLYVALIGDVARQLLVE